MTLLFNLRYVKIGGIARFKTAEAVSAWWPFIQWAGYDPIDAHVRYIKDD